MLLSKVDFPVLGRPTKATKPDLVIRFLSLPPSFALQNPPPSSEGGFLLSNMVLHSNDSLPKVREMDAEVLRTALRSLQLSLFPTIFSSKVKKN